MFHEPASLGDRVIAEVFRVFLPVRCNRNGEVRAIRLDEIEIQEALVVGANIPRIIAVSQQPLARCPMGRPVRAETSVEEDRNVDEVGFFQFQVPSLSVDRAELFVGPGEDQVGVPFQQCIQAIKRAPRPAAEHVNVIPLATYGKPVIAVEPGQVFFEAAGIGSADEDLLVRFFAGFGEDRHSGAGDLFDPVADVVRCEHLGPGCRIRQNEFTGRLSILHQGRL